MEDLGELLILSNCDLSSLQLLPCVIIIKRSLAQLTDSITPVNRRHIVILLVFIIHLIKDLDLFLSEVAAPFLGVLSGLSFTFPFTTLPF